MTNEQRTPPPAGWYENPSGGTSRRWWDGEAWTDHVEADAPASNPRATPSGPFTFLGYELKRGVVAVVVIIAVILGGMIVNSVSETREMQDYYDGLYD